MEVTLFKNALVIQNLDDFTVLKKRDVAVKGDKIVEVGTDLALKYKEKKVIDCTDKIVMPGNVCSHHHYYSALSRGMLVNAGVQNDFVQVLKEWWWRLDRALDEEALYYSSLICSIDAIGCGTTSCVDHHASPSFIEGSLETIAKGMEEIGIRGLTCYEVTDRNGGMDEVRLGVNENVAFARSVDKKRSSGENVLVEAMIGAHAPFTLPNKALELMSEATETTQRSIHLHVAEDKYDTVHSHHLYHQDIMERLDRFNLLNEKTLLVHGLWLNEKEIELMNERKSFLAHNPRSNMNNNVGYFKNLTKVKNLVLGTDGCGGNMFEEIKLAFFKHKDQGGAWWPTDFVKVLNRGNRLLELYFKAKFGSVAAGCKADLVVLDYNSPTPLVNDNGASHIVWGISSNAVESVMVDGKMVMENRTFGFDVKEIYAKAREVAKRVWQKVDTISPH